MFNMPFQKGHPFYGDKSNYFKKEHPSLNKGGYKIKDTSNMSKAKMGNTNGFQKGIHPNNEWKKGDLRLTGVNNPNWNNGSSFEPYSIDWTETLRRSIKERDHYICQLCNEIQGDRVFHIHHIDYAKNNCNPENLVTLCPRCHAKTNFNREYWKQYFQTKLCQEKRQK